MLRVGRDSELRPLNVAQHAGAVTRPLLGLLQKVTVATALDGTNGEDHGNAWVE
jgi:hypothetical protein